MRIHFKPVYQFSAFRTGVLCNFLSNPLSNPYLLHAHRVGNHIGMIANAVYHGFCAEFLQLFARELFAFIAASNLMTCGAVKKTVVSAVFAALANVVGKAAMTILRKRGARPAKQAADRRTFFGRYSVHKSFPPQIPVCRVDYTKQPEKNLSQCSVPRQDSRFVIPATPVRIPVESPLRKFFPNSVYPHGKKCQRLSPFRHRFCIPSPTRQGKNAAVAEVLDFTHILAIMMLRNHERSQILFGKASGTRYDSYNK